MDFSPRVDYQDRTVLTKTAIPALLTPVLERWFQQPGKMVPAVS
jgi:hypothetical protein